ncbi:MAG: hypothetical protein ACOYLC_09510 [Armatimonadaceae bacterium]|jgi:hypothetical protein
MEIYTAGSHQIGLSDDREILAMGDAQLGITSSNPDARITLTVSDMAAAALTGICDQLIVRKASHMAELDALDLQAIRIEVTEATGASKVRLRHNNVRIERISQAAIIVVDGYGIAEIVQDRARLLITGESPDACE